MTKKSNYLIIPDVHGRSFWKDAVRGREQMKIVFLGDYLDPYEWEEITPGDATRELEAILEFKKKHMDNVTLLLGNHDLGYLAPFVNTCRRDIYGAERNRRILTENLDLFDIVHVADGPRKDYLFSHAGIRKDWVGKFERLWGKDGFEPELLNRWFHNPALRTSLLKTLSSVSFMRGGDDSCGSPVWADMREFIAIGDFLPRYMHIFGHTLHDGGPVLIKNGDESGLCLDCAQAFIMRKDGTLVHASRKTA